MRLRDVVPLVPMALSVILALASLAFANPLRSADLGDRLGALTVGLRSENGSPIKIGCPGHAIWGIRTFYYIPGVPPDGGDSASVVTVQVDSVNRVAFTFDETDLSVPVMVYAADNNGVIRYMEALSDRRPVNVPALCEAALKDLE